MQTFAFPERKIGFSTTLRPGTTTGHTLFTQGHKPSNFGIGSNELITLAVDVDNLNRLVGFQVLA